MDLADGLIRSDADIAWRLSNQRRPELKLRGRGGAWRRQFRRRGNVLAGLPSGRAAMAICES